MTSIGIVYNDIFFREAVKTFLNEQHKYTVVFDEQSQSELIKKIQLGTVMPDIIFMDLSIPVARRVEMMEILKREFPFIKVVSISLTHNSN